MSQSNKSILFVDLDGTLIASDMLIEALIPLLARQSRILFRIPAWLLGGRAKFKHALARHVSLDVGGLPYRDDVLLFLREQKQLGRTLVLATASDRQWAESVAESQQLFDAVLASDGVINLKGEHKLKAIEQYCVDHQASDFGYVGDSSSDLPIWQKATDIYAVEPNAAVLRTLDRTGRLRKVFGKRKSLLRESLRSMRPHQWVKNILVFVPIIAAHRWNEWQAVLAACLSFIAFSACASAIYVVNDILDLQADRIHPSKRRRPFASGALRIGWSPVIVTILTTVAFGLSLGALPLTFTAILLLYLTITTLYSSLLKRKPLIDVFTLAGLYTIRIFAGGLATNIPISEWLLVFSIFLFTSLAFVKRFAELRRLALEEKFCTARRGYIVEDLSLVESMGISSGYLSVLVLALYIHSPEISALYTHRWALWLVCPIFMYWVSRVWIQAKRGILTEDPIVFALTDWVSLVIAGISTFLLLLAR